MLDVECRMRDAGCGALGAPLSSRVHPPVVWAGGWWGKQLQIHHLNHSAAGEHQEHPPIHLTREKNPQPQEGGEANWFAFRSAAPSWLRFAC